MDFRQNFYKDKYVQEALQKRPSTTKILQKNRNNLRQKEFQKRRNISPSCLTPRLIKKEPIDMEQKENIDQHPNAKDQDESRIIYNSKDNSVLSRQRDYMLRLFEWKKSKVTKQQTDIKRKPFIPVGSISNSTKPKTISNKDQKEENKSRLKGRPSLYKVKSPKKIKTKAEDTSLNSIKRNIVAPNASTIRNLVTSFNIPSTSTGAIPKAKLKLSAEKKLNINKERIKSKHMPPPPPPTVSRMKLEPQPQQNINKIKPPGGTGAVGKIRSLQNKTKEESNKNTKLGLSMKAKKGTKNANQKKALNEKKLIVAKKQVDSSQMVQTPRDITPNPFEMFVTSTRLKESTSPIAPQDISPINSQLKTETQESSGCKRQLLPNVQQVQKEKNSFQTGQKFNFIRYSVGTKKVQDNDNKNNEAKNQIEVDIDFSKLTNHHQDKENAHFIRHSIADKNEVNEKDQDKRLAQTPSILEDNNAHTPEKPIVVSYLSPCVSVSRGKVNRKQEACKRQSIIMQCNNLKELDENAAGVRHALEGVRYYREQIEKEIERLRNVCDMWENYKQANSEQLREMNGDDMINATIGQTGLLINKKFKQFSNLIDRCEANVTGVNQIQDDGSENTKPITITDLEGFWWSMIKLQLDNLEKRFENLNRWKANDWKDPDEIIPEQQIKPEQKKAIKMKKPGTKAKQVQGSASAFIAMMRKRQADKRNNEKRPLETENCELVLTPTKGNRKNSHNKNNDQNNSLNGTFKHTVVVKDRKFMSPSATRLSLPRSNRSSPNLARNPLNDSLKLSPAIEQLNNSFKNLKDAVNLRKSILSNTVKSPEEVKTPEQNIHGRKSILKTPGTARSKLKTVLFNDKLRVKKFKFIIDDGVTNGDNEDSCDGSTSTYEENMVEESDNERLYSLRTRKVVLRPSSEIIIPLPPK